MSQSIPPTPEEQAESAYLELVRADPYRHRGGKPLALAVTSQFAAPVARTDTYHAAVFLSFADHMLRMLWDALAYWTPDRIEHAALVRAGDSAEPSLLAREVAIFSVQYFKKWLPALSEWGRIDHECTKMREYQRALHVRDLLQEALLSLERRSAAVEARALDLRLRFDMKAIQALMAREELAVAVLSAVEQAARAADEARLEAVRSEMDRAAAKLEPRLGKLEDAVDFVWERAAKQFAKEELLSGGGLRKGAEALAAGIRSVAISAVLKRLLGA
jgi:hypothetical protein